MTAIEILERAISKLETLCDSARPLPYGALTSGRRGGDHWYLTSADEMVALISANDGIDEDLRQPTAELLAALSRTVEPMLLVLRLAVSHYNRWSLAPEQWARYALHLACSILGEEKTDDE